MMGSALVMKRRSRLIAAAVLLLVALGVGIGALVFFPGARSDDGIADDRKDVDLVNVIAFAERANAAYHEAKIFRHEYGAQVAAGEFPNSGLRIYLDSNPTGKAQWLILRGTANMPNLFDDLDFVGHDEHELGISVHAGFDGSLQECLPWVIEHLDPKRPVWVTGHSLGGAVAVLLVATLDHRGYKDVSAITFGQPKFTDAHGAAMLAHLNILRIVHNEDPVPMLPPLIVGRGYLAGYEHFGPEVIVSSSGHFHFLPRHAKGRLDVSKFRTEIGHIKPMSHDMVRGYLPALHHALAGIPKGLGAAK
jgi:triacylglycerol lipase